MLNHKNIPNKYKIALIVTVLILLCATFYVVYVAYFKNESIDNPETEGIINMDPPTDEEVAETEAHKEEVVKRQDLDSQNHTSDSGRKKSANVTIGSWPTVVNKNDKVEISGFISNVYESGGQCTLKLAKDDKTITANKSARKDAQTTTCGFIPIERSKLSRGTWEASISYSSDSAKGISQSVNIKVK